MTPAREPAWRLYADARMAKVLFLGFISGFPWLLIGSMASLWLHEEGLSRTGVGLFGAVFAVYAFNALWAPVVDGARIPFLSERFGRRRAWIILMQCVIAAAMAGLYFLPSARDYLWAVAALMLVISSASATQDIAIDAARIEMFGEDEPRKMGGASAMATSGWWLGFGGGKALVFPLIESMQTRGAGDAWQSGYLILIAVIVLSIAGVIRFIRLPQRPISSFVDDDGIINVWNIPSSSHGFMRRALLMYWQPIQSFARNYAPALLALSLLAFIFFFKIGEAFLGRMSLLFYKEIGFSKGEIGMLSGGLGTVTVCAFAIFGGFVNARYGLFKGIVLGGAAMASTNLLFALLYYYPEKWLFAFAVVADQFTTAVSTVAFVAFLSRLCDRAHTAAQYAALASVGNLARTSLAVFSGALVDALGGNWARFFVITVLMVLPGFIILFAIRRRLAPVLSGAG